MPAIQSLHLPVDNNRLGSGLPSIKDKGFPEFDKIYLPVTHVSSP